MRCTPAPIKAEQDSKRALSRSVERDRMRKIRVGVHLNPEHGDYTDYRRAVLELDQMGVDVITVWDHFYPLTGDPNGKHFECWTLLSAIAAMTERIEMGPLVSAIGYRNPNLIADMARTIDHISGGRFILGLGGGWSEKDYTEYGYEYGTPGSRLRDLRDALPVIEARLGKLNPPPTRHIPIMIGGGGEKVTLRITAKHADIWHCNASGEELAHKSQVLEDWCRREGRDPKEIEHAAGAGANTTFETADSMIDAGVTLFTYRSTGPKWNVAPVKEWLAWRDQHNRQRG
jgi:probable F420-dependent oxidoreductase